MGTENPQQARVFRAIWTTLGTLYLNQSGAKKGHAVTLNCQKLSEIA